MQPCCRRFLSTHREVAYNQVLAAAVATKTSPLACLLPNLHSPLDSLRLSRLCPEDVAAVVTLSQCQPLLFFPRLQHLRMVAYLGQIAHSLRPRRLQSSSVLDQRARPPRLRVEPLLPAWALLILPLHLESVWLKAIPNLQVMGRDNADLNERNPASNRRHLRRTSNRPFLP